MLENRSRVPGDLGSHLLGDSTTIDENGGYETKDL